MMDVFSYVSVDGVKFGADETALILRFGAPKQRRKNREQELELWFDGFILRLEANSGAFRECTLLPSFVVALNGKPISWGAEFLTRLSADDPDLRLVHGFVISLRLGVALSGFHDGDESQKAIHFFRRGDWDMFLPKMRPFHISE